MSEEKTGKVMPQEVAIDALKKMGKEHKPSGANIIAVKMSSDFLFQGADDSVYQGESGDVIYIEKGVEGAVPSIMSGADFDSEYQKA